MYVLESRGRKTPHQTTGGSVDGGRSPRGAAADWSVRSVRVDLGLLSIIRHCCEEASAVHCMYSVSGRVCASVCVCVLGFNVA